MDKKEQKLIIEIEELRHKFKIKQIEAEKKAKIELETFKHEKDLERLANNQVNAFRKAVDDVKENANQIKTTNPSGFLRV